jgi:hypothetical protein
MAKILSSTEEKVRLSLAMPPQTKQLIDDLQRRTSAGSMTETIRRAFALLDVITAQEEKGGELYLHWPDGQQSRIHIL